MFTNRIGRNMDLLETKSSSVPGEDVSDDEACVLPADTMLILQQFLQEKELKERSEKAGAEPEGCFEENWQLSQFWYNEETKQKLSLLVRRVQEETISEPFRVALLSAPSAFKHVVNENKQAMLFEFDERFASYGDNFQQYDYNRAYDTGYMDAFADQFDLIIADPPFLSEECIEKIGVIVKKISKKDAKIVLCSGAVVQEWAKKYLGVSLCQFRPEHERNLGNEFRSYANFDLDSMLNKGC
ncbi:protein-lysine N-methyltransferase CG9154 [Anopheles stephensi]|uniref:protein-lysine N-methyltransferase CG9154 n=1 Tax=Anopheles stephensi TaxID=30069 RepID=UPI0016589974|nr:protein-lysine N-methyltransferase CG9154 [Anopheles stephensi]